MADDTKKIEGTTSTDTAPDAGKLFTQDELDKIVQTRLNREKERLSAMINDDAAIREELRVNKLKLEKTKDVTEKGLPVELLELLDYTDQDTCNASFDKLVNVIGLAAQNSVDKLIKSNGYIPPKGNGAGSAKDGLKGAFGL